MDQGQLYEVQLGQVLGPALGTQQPHADLKPCSTIPVPLSSCPPHGHEEHLQCEDRKRRRHCVVIGVHLFTFPSFQCFLRRKILLLSTSKTTWRSSPPTPSTKSLLSAWPQKPFWYHYMKSVARRSRGVQEKTNCFKMLPGRLLQEVEPCLEQCVCRMFYLEARGNREVGWKVV